MEAETKRVELQGVADAAVARQTQLEQQNKLLHAEIQKLTEATASGAVPSAGALVLFTGPRPLLLICCQGTLSDVQQQLRSSESLLQR